MEVDFTKSVDDTKSTGNAGWADAMQKILRTKKTKRKGTVVLAKAKKLCDVKETEKKENISLEIIKPRRKERSLSIRVKPCITDRERERMLQKIATRGVIQLFNAVRQQQTEISKKLSEAGPLERKREQVMKNINKNAFLDILMGKSESVPVDDTAESEKMVKSIGNRDKDDKIWGVLRDDFGMGAKLKDWDKKDTEEEDSSTSNDSDDMDSDDMDSDDW